MAYNYRRLTFRGAPKIMVGLIGAIHQAYMRTAHLFLTLHSDLSVVEKEPYRIVDVSEDGTELMVRYYCALSERYCDDETHICTISFVYDEKHATWRSKYRDELRQFEKFMEVKDPVDEDTMKAAMYMMYLREGQIWGGY